MHRLAFKAFTRSMTTPAVWRSTPVLVTSLGTSYRLHATGGSTPKTDVSAATASASSGAGPELDAEAAEQVRLAKEIGEEAFGENTAILKQVGFRGLRAFAVCAVGVGAFMYAMRRKKKELAAEEALKRGVAGEEEEDNPTQRYLEEMRSLGFDVDTLEEELEQERITEKSDVVGSAASA